MRIFIYILVIESLLLGNPVGGFQGSFTSISTDAISGSLGNINILNNKNVFGPQNNPALMTNGKYSFGISYNQLSLDRYSQSIIFGFKIPPSAHASLGYNGNGIKNINGRNSSGEITKTFNWSNHHIYFTFGIIPVERISIGLKLNIYFQNVIEEINSSGLGLDVGLFLNPIEKLNFAMTIKNIKAKTNWKINMDDGTMRDYNEYFPLIYSFSSQVQIIESFNIYSQFNFYNDDSFGYIGSENIYGIEYILNNFEYPINLRCGLNEKDISIGFSLPYKTLSNMNYAVTFSRLNSGTNHIFTWDIKL